MAGKAGKKVNLAKVFKETEQFQKPDLEVVESAPAAQRKPLPLVSRKNMSAAISTKPSIDR